MNPQGKCSLVHAPLRASIPALSPSRCENYQSFPQKQIDQVLTNKKTSKKQQGALLLLFRMKLGLEKN